VYRHGETTVHNDDPVSPGCNGRRENGNFIWFTCRREPSQMRTAFAGFKRSQLALNQRATSVTTIVADGSSTATLTYTRQSMNSCLANSPR